jgi:excisionase family DNA binding protein
MAFAIDRVEAARRLSISTRTVDRHISAGRIRTKRIGKKMFLHEEDVEFIRTTDPDRHDEEYIIIDDSDTIEHEIISRGKVQETAPVVYTAEWPNFVTLYETAQKTIVKKDEIIQDLAYRLGKAETELKSSIPLTEYKKTTFLLESAKAKTDSDAVVLSEKIAILEKDMAKKNSSILGLAILFILVLAFSVVFFLYTQFL